jgi:hypothetical protein
MSRLGALAVVAAALGSLSACGGGGSGTPSPVSTPTPAPVQTVVRQGSFTIRGPEADGFTYYDHELISTSATGRLETTVNWTYATNSVWMYVAEGDCTGGQFDNLDCPGGPTCECQFSAVSESDSPKPRILTVASAGAGVRTLIVWNRGPQEESVSYQAVLTTTAAGSTATAPPGAAAHAGRVDRPRRRVQRR